MGNFVLDLSKFCQKAKIAPSTVLKKVAFDLYARIVSRTPVDTGRARANWQIGINKMPTGTIDSGFSKEKGKRWSAGGGATGLGEAVGRGEQLAIGQSGASGVLSGNIGPTDEIWIANNVEYIKPLEDGHSRQAPRGMVKVSITEFQSFVAKAVASL